MIHWHFGVLRGIVVGVRALESSEVMGSIPVTTVQTLRDGLIRQNIVIQIWNLGYFSPNQLRYSIRMFIKLPRLLFSILYKTDITPNKYTFGKLWFSCRLRKSKNKIHLVSSGLNVGWENSVLEFQFCFILVLFVLMIATPYNQLVKTNYSSLTEWK